MSAAVAPSTPNGHVSISTHAGSSNAPTLPLTSASSSPGSLRSAVQGFFRAAVASERSTLTTSPTSPLYMQSPPDQATPSSLATAAAATEKSTNYRVVTVQAIHNDKLLEKHTSGIIKAKRLSKVDVERVVHANEGHNFYQIQAILRSQNSQTNALAAHIGYDLVLERYHEMRRVEKAAAAGRNLSPRKAAPAPTRRSLSTRRSLYEKLSLVQQTSKLVVADPVLPESSLSAALSPSTPRTAVRRTNSGDGCSVGGTGGSRTPPRRTPSRNPSSSSSHSRSPPRTKSTSTTWGSSPLEASPEKEEPIHAILVSPTCVKHFVKMDRAMSSGTGTGTGPTRLQLDTDSSDDDKSRDCDKPGRTLVRV